MAQHIKHLFESKEPAALAPLKSKVIEIWKNIFIVMKMLLQCRPFGNAPSHTMQMNDLKHAIQWCLITTAMLFLCACATPVAHKPATTVADTAGKPKEPAALIPATESSFRNQQVIMPNENIEKNKLAISYSIKSVPGEKAPLLQLSVTFRNMKDKNVSLHPKITLSDAKGSHFEAYSKKGFIKQATNLSRESTPGVADEKIKWANTYWLKENFTIPANGIEIGELIFHCKTVCQPKRLTLRSGKQEFVFNISEAAVAAPEKR